MIKRHIEAQLLKTISNFPVTGIIGPRQVGKTTLAKQISKKLKKEVIYLDMENPRDTIRLSDPLLFFEQNTDKCIVLDEIQLMPELFSILRPMVDLKREGARYIILGSATPEIIRKSSQTLAGRIAYIELSGFNLLELKASDFKQLWLKGGYPDAYLSADNEIWQQWIDNFIKTYIERDLPMLGLNVNAKILRQLWTMVSYMHGSVSNYSNVSKSLEMSSTTIKKYLDFMEGAFLINQLQPFYYNIKKRIVKSPKVYIRDTGILHNLINISTMDQLEGNPLKGNSFEGIAIEQILQLAKPKYEAFFYRTHHGAECDLILSKSSKPVYAIEIKYSSTPKPTKGNLIAFEDIKAPNNFIIGPDTNNFAFNKNIEVCSLFDFLKNFKISA